MDTLLKYVAHPLASIRIETYKSITLLMKVSITLLMKVYI